MNDFSWIGPTLKLVASGALETVIIAVASVVIAVVLGVNLGVLLCLPAGRWNNAVRWALTLFRGLPVLVTLFIVFFVSPSLGLDLASTPAAIAALSLWGSANVMEVVRGGKCSLSYHRREGVARAQRSAGLKLDRDSYPSHIE